MTYRMTPARAAALRKAQLASAAKRRKNVTLYHYTTPRRARKIVKQQRFKPSHFAPGNKKHAVYFTKSKSQFYKNHFRPLGRKSAVVSVRVPKSYVRRDVNDKFFRPYVRKT